MYRWPSRLQEYYRSTNILVCPADALRGTPQTAFSTSVLADKSPRSYLINGWNDYFNDTLSSGDFGTYMSGTFSRAFLKESLVVKPTDTVMFGEKKNVALDYFMDSMEGLGGNDADRVEHGAHGVPRLISGTGGSNLAFVDGSARYMRYGADTWPLNLWCISDFNRLTYAFHAP
jgi:prepilin-type processing-associated H-X9-DG protein